MEFFFLNRRCFLSRVSVAFATARPFESVGPRDQFRAPLEDWHRTGKRSGRFMQILCILIIPYLVGGDWNMFFMTFHIEWEYLGIIIPTDEVIFFRGVGQPPSSLVGGFKHFFFSSYI